MFYQRALNICELQFGLDHPDVASSLTNLASAYKNQGKYDEAEALYQRVLTIFELEGEANWSNTFYTLALYGLNQVRYGEIAFGNQLVGHFSLNVEVVSAEHSERLGRNTLCYCKSGKRYKHCHGKL